MTMQEDGRIAAFHREALGILDRTGDNLEARHRIQSLLVDLARQPDILPDVSLNRLHTTGSSATILHQGAGGHGALMLLRLPPDVPTPVHNHNSWGVSCVVSGRNRYWRWHRFDTGESPDRADLRIDAVFDQGPGDSTLWEEPPQDWHAQQGLDGDAIEFVFFGRNPLLRPRAYFDPETGTVTYAFASEQEATDQTDAASSA